MTTENRPQLHLEAGPPTEDDWEMSFAGTLSEAVNTLFTYRTVVEQLRAWSGDEATAEFVRHWKASLAQHLEATGQMAVWKFLVDLERFQAHRAAPDQTPETSPTDQG